MRRRFFLPGSLYPAAVGLLLLSCTMSSAQLEEKLRAIKLPPGFEISVYAANVENARSMTLSPNGTLFVGTRNAGKVHAVVDSDGDFKADAVHTVYAAEQLPDGQKMQMPNGVAFRDGDLYVAAVSHILRFDDIEDKLQSPPQPVIVTDKYPTAGHHGWKFIAFGPDGKLYVPVGAPCNICARNEEIFATITRIDADGSNFEIIARGVRHTVGFDWHPETGHLWFTENGADGLGDNFPPDKLNVLTKPGQHFGYPYCHGGEQLDKDFGGGHSCDDFTPPAMKLGPHVAALGMRFYTGDMFPDEYTNQIFIAEHGSWNRTNKIGYRVMLVRLDDNNQAVAYEDFATGWLQGEQDWGRPADVLVMPDGSLLVSDDKANAIYRITYSGN
ncbi:MAG: sorbosone dehydrogenase family protein [Candidatus Hydrogenedentales bacterium]